ncbi:MAG: hypothetical protein AAFV19_02965 [Pseudomonadota bacterium]
MSIRSYIAMVYALVAVLVFGLALPGGTVHAERKGCKDHSQAAAITGHVSDTAAKIEVDENWLGWLMWEPAVYEVPVLPHPAATLPVSCGVAAPQDGAARLDLAVTATQDLNTITLPVIDTRAHPGAAYLLDAGAEDADLPAFLSQRPGTPVSGQEPLWLTIETQGHQVELWSDTHPIDVTAVPGARIVTLAADADLTDPVFVLRYRLVPDAPLLAATQQGI